MFEAPEDCYYLTFKKLLPEGLASTQLKLGDEVISFVT